MHCQRRGVRNKGKMLITFCCFTWRYFSKWRTTQPCLYLIPTFNDRNNSDWFVRALRRVLTVTTWAPYLLRSNKNFYVHVFLCFLCCSSLLNSTLELNRPLLCKTKASSTICISSIFNQSHFLLLRLLLRLEVFNLKCIVSEKKFHISNSFR